MNASLESLAPVVDGSVSDNRLRGSYEGYGVEAWTSEQRPGYTSHGLVTGPRINVFHLELTGVGGRHNWDCRSGLTPFANLLVVLPWRLMYSVAPKEFRFRRSGTTDRIARRLGVAESAGPALQERLRTAGLLDELDALRWGPSPYLPTAVFSPRSQAMGAGSFGGYQAKLQEALAARGHSELVPELGEQFRAAREDSPGQLLLQVELGKAAAPSDERFQELLGHAARIAKINADENA